MPPKASTPEALIVSVGADTLAYLESGSGPALVIVHGVGRQQKDSAGVQSALEAHWRLLADDMLMHRYRARELPLVATR